ncbi:hypothetical protein GUJ93_ZPchr0008g13373 [Zizania palustris]|uniref:Uncharacterized protein n=1 Tax=Zizania palustris TaxID=103762 RepID=A0A8J5R747_ZIZPA|nr:hypothetical protein GUJ93_ZPchr0008g13373 [Zizania palustris]
MNFGREPAQSALPRLDSRKGKTRNEVDSEWRQNPKGKSLVRKEGPLRGGLNKLTGNRSPAPGLVELLPDQCHYPVPHHFLK